MVREKQSCPVEVWSPMFSISPFDEKFARDLQNVQELYEGEDCIWLSPDVEKVHRWRSRDGHFISHQCLIPSETINRIIVNHVDESGRVYPPLSLPDEWEKCLTEALYLKWLSKKPKIYLGTKSMPIEPWPIIKDGKPVYGRLELKLKPGPLVYVDSVDEKRRIVEFSWPPKGIKLPYSVSPETQSRKIHRRLKWETVIVEGKKMDIVVPEDDPTMRAANFWFIWPEPFDRLLGVANMDLLNHYGVLGDCVNNLNEGKNYEEVLQMAETWVNLLTSEATATVEAAWFMPKLYVNPKEIWTELESKFGLSPSTWDEKQSQLELDSKRIINLRCQEMKVRRIQGWLGYFWWEFYQDLKSNVTVKLCRHCGTIIRGGHTDRQFCKKEENPECYRERNAERQRKSRKRRSTDTK